MAKFKIAQKGLILVAVPLIFGIGYISVLFVGLVNTSRLIDRQSMLKDAVISHLCTMTTGAASLAGRNMYIGTHTKIWKDYYTTQQQRAGAYDKRLRHLLKKERTLRIPNFPVTFHAIENNANHRAETPLLVQLKSMSTEESRAVTRAIDSLRLILWSGVAAGFLVSLVLATFFCLNITNRLLLIVSNALNLSHGTALTPPRKGSDEIAELDQLLYKSASELRELERFKKEMVTLISYELNSPLSSVHNFLSRLSAGKYITLNAKTQDKVDRTHGSVERLMGLVDELHSLDRLELEIHPEEFQIDDLLAESVDAVKGLSEKSGIEFKVTNSGGKLYADRNRLIQVVVNLLSNAIKFSPQNGQVTIDAQSTDGFFKCRVTDQGPGIPESFRKKMFQPFEQADLSDATKKKGTGLGLNISRSIVEQHGGQIGVDSEEGKGSSFWFSIPERMSVRSTSSNPTNQTAYPQAGKYGVLKKGMIIIALPLVFQIGFAILFGNMLDGICKQVKQEDNSMAVLEAVTNCTNTVTSALGESIAQVYVPVPWRESLWPNSKEAGLRYVDTAIALSSENPDQVKDLKTVKKELLAGSAVLEREFKTQESKKAFDKLDFAFRRMVYTICGSNLEPVTPEEKLDAEIGMPSFRMLSAFESFSNDRLHKELPPFLRSQVLLDKTMDRESKSSQQAAKLRSDKIKTTEIVLVSGILSTVIISVLIALFLMRNITRRLQHVMANTRRLAKREMLDTPIAGTDEIAYLDRVLFETSNRLVELESFKRELVSIVSHELRTPLMSISAGLELFRIGILGELSEEGLHQLDFAQRENKRLIRLISDILDIEKIQAGKFELDKKECNVVELIESSISSTAELAAGKRIKIESGTADEGLKILADADRLSQVLGNVLSNAIHLSPEGSKISVQAKRHSDGQVKFIVREQDDSRWCRTETDAASIAELRARGGSNFGMAVSKRIVELHDGKIGVENTDGAGITWFTVPSNGSNVSGGKTTPGTPENSLPELKLRKVFLVQVLEAAVERVESTADKLGIAIEAGGTRAIVNADFDAMLDVLEKLLSIAVTYVGEENSISLDTLSTDNEVELRVVFSSRQELSFIEASKDKDLRYCKSIIAMHNGTMYYQRESAQHLAICLKLPLRES